MPSDKMYLVDAECHGDLNELRYAHRHRDVQNASQDMPDEESLWSQRAQPSGPGPIALCCSIHSALGNGAVSWEKFCSVRSRGNQGNYNDNYALPATAPSNDGAGLPCAACMTAPAPE